MPTPRLTREALLPYPAFHRMTGICHVRIFEAPGQRPIAIAGEMADNTVAQPKTPPPSGPKAA